MLSLLPRRVSLHIYPHLIHPHFPTTVHLGFVFTYWFQLSHVRFQHNSSTSHYLFMHFIPDPGIYVPLATLIQFFLDWAHL